MSYKIRVEKGPDWGLVFDLPEIGASLGRSKTNDIVFHDETLSRQHCRIFASEGKLFVADLATVNGTAVNDVTIDTDTAITPGDLIAIGHTTLRLSDKNGSFDNLPEHKPEPLTVQGAAARVAAAAATASAEAKADGARQSVKTAPDGTIDLGFSPAQDAAAPSIATAKNPRSLVIAISCVCAAIVLIAGAAKFLLGDDKPDAPVMEALPPPPPLAFSYLKTDATASGIFRYEMSLDADGNLAVVIDDIAANRHLRKSTQLSPDSRHDLQRKFERSGIQSLNPAYEGIPLENTWNSARISAGINGRAVTVEVRNHLAPESFRSLQEDLETFGRNELGLWAFALSREDLIQRAEEALLNGNRFYEERDIRRDNLFQAIRAYDSCLAHLESLEPKPNLYNLAVQGRTQAVNDLAALLDELNWQADHGTNTRDWTAAQNALRTILEYVPDRNDDRYRSAEKRLLDVETRLRKQ
ncbi:MAG: FHA domain-containing protein [Kiritimatiellia bacterium]